MLKNYFKIAWRNIGKHKFHSLLNILGLSFGIAFTLLIAAYVWGELHVNHQLKNLNNQYIIQSNWTNPDMGLELTTVGPMVKTLAEEYPSLVANYYRWDGVTSNVSNGDKVFREGLQIGDSSMLNMYGFTLIYGDLKTSLTEPFSIVITEDRAIKYFGKKDVVGQSLTIESFSGSKHAFKITGVMKSPPYNSINNITFDNDNQIYIPVASAAFFSRSLDQWDNPNIVGFLELKDGVKAADLTEPMRRILKQQASDNIAANMQPYLVPLKEFYLQQNNGLVKRMLYTVSLIALFILIMAVINFINISIGKSSTRIKEIGVRKVMGGKRSQIIYQLLSESVLLVFLSMILALVIFTAGNPFLSQVLGKSIPSLYSFPVYYILVPLLLIFVVGILAGIYPAFILSALKTVDSVKGKLQSVNGNIALRKLLVGFQFTTASVVLIGATILAKQVSLFFSKDLGYDKEYIVSVQLPRDWTAQGVRHMQMVRDEFEKMPEVGSASITWSVPDGKGSGTLPLYATGQDSSQSFPYESLIADEKYLSVFKIPLLAGRTFQQPGDSLNVVINESAVRSLGLKNAEQAIGNRLYFSPDFSLNVIGVISDFHFGSMKDKIRPMVINHVGLNKLYRLLCFKLKPGNIGESMGSLQKKWAALMPGSSFEYKFMDDSLNQLYRSEIQLKKASQVATALALIVVLLGIIGMISLSIQKRTKEIGIRKILGATLANISSLFMKDFLPVIFISGIISIPISWYLMNSWLNDYSYRIAITAWPFVIAVTGLGLITSLIILLQISKAALANPVKSLRTE
jgi:ABC-type antimicrobial peptide transport system permease subunit